MTNADATVHQRALSSLLSKVGKDYEPDPALPLGLVAGTMRLRLVWLMRGYARLRRVVFVGPGVKLRGKRGLVVGRGATIERGASIDGYARNGVHIGERTRLGAHTIVSSTSHLSRYGEGFSIGRDSGIGEFGYVGAAGGVWIGDNVIMGQFVSFHSQEHEFEASDRPIRQQGLREEPITIGDDCWIGARVTFLAGAHVPEGCVVAAGSVVRGVFEPYSVIAGVPARVVRDRREPRGK
jgi:acetyltransferase-like isoleucine patch superfamily enzyme